MSLQRRLRELHAFDNGAELLLGRLVFRRTALQVHRIGDLHIIVDHRASDAGSVRACIAGPMYRGLLPQMQLPADATLVDLGANVGGFTLLVAASGIRLGRALCVEMNPETCERLRFNVLTNGIPADVVNAAVCARAREIRVCLGRGSTGDNIYRGTDRRDGPVRERTIRGESLDTLCEDLGVIDLMKMDIEGAEDEVLLDPDSQNAALDRVRHLVIEVHHAETAGPIFAMLSRRGFELSMGESESGLCGVHLLKNAALARRKRAITVVPVDIATVGPAEATPSEPSRLPILP